MDKLKPKPPAERQAWIMTYLAKRTTSAGYMFVDVLDRAFSDAYIEDNNATCQYTLIGANVCRMLGEDLSALARAGKLERYRAGVYDRGRYSGFPTWVWSYSIPRSKQCPP